jgi:hypothetical protein
MPMELLARLCEAALPCEVVDADDIEKLVVLCADGLVEADIPPLMEEGGLRWFASAARVRRVLAAGVVALRGRGLACTVRGRCAAS